jgi:hypothetical protein
MKLVVLSCGLALVLCGCKGKPADPDEQKVAEAITQMKGAFSTDQALPGNAIVEIDFTYAHGSPPTWLRIAKKCKHLRSLYLGGEVDDSDLLNIQELTELRTFSLTGADITDRGLKVFENLRHLENLTLNHCRIKGLGLKYIKDKETLRSISLQATQIDDQALRY